MRVLLAVFPSAAHLHPIVPLARALMATGHEVRVAMHPDLVDIVTAAGLKAMPIGRPQDLAGVVELNKHPERLESLTSQLALDPEASEDWENKWHQVLNVLSLYPAVLDDLVEGARKWRPDLVIWDTFCLPGAIAARAVGAAHVRYLWGQDNVGFLREKVRTSTGTPGGTHSGDPMAELFEPMLRRYGFEFQEEFLVGQSTLDLMPPGMALPLGLARIPMRRVPYNGTAPRPGWLDGPQPLPRVCFTLGLGGRGRQFFRETGVSLPELLDAVADLDIELVATLDAGQIAEVGTVPDNVRTTGYVPLDMLLPSCSAVVHHGGGGTFTTAVEQRVPQLVTPLPFWGETATARYVERRGAGLVLNSADFTADALRDRLLRLVRESSFAAGAATLHEEFLATPSPDEVVPVLEQLAGKVLMRPSA